ncbi:hypothetical protein [Nodosilinea sp. E11]|uniref:hypothetical protein n=1 Tax=Nodosilinea sp. E11 TaxID=3037479 RepID=UPI002934CB73|nr:hypothetical protein [Nodosilinea sp. E11]WOD41485.1 hypothetical protein RRF56_11835 [Nodosilinea sp. E11]
MAIIFSEPEVQALAAAIDQELAGIDQTCRSSVQRSLEEPDAPLAKQTSAIERITKEQPVTFLKKFRKAAKADLCKEGGALNAQWQQWKDLASGDVVKNFGPVLVAMGFTGVLLETLVVAVGVIVIHIGLKAFCEEFGD